MGRRQRWGRRLRVVLVAGGVVALLAVGACGGDDDDDGGAGAPEAGGGTGTTAAGGEGPAAGDDEATSGEVPDPCTLLDAGELQALLGTDPGAGDSQAVVPDERKVCLFETGTILAVEVASHWDGSLEIIRETFGADALEAVPGVGEAAYWQEAGAQFFALGDRYFVGVTGPGREAGQAVAEAMLAAL